MLEKSCGWWPIWYLLFFCHGGAEGQLQWVVKEKVTDYGQNVTLFCPVENCCSELAGWSVGQVSIFIDLKKYSNDSSKKYGGTYNKDGFGVVIRNLSEADLNVTHRCDYGFNRSTPKYLLHDDVFTESTDVPDKDKDEENNTVTLMYVPGKDEEIDIAAIVVPIVVIMVGFIIGIACRVYRSRRKNKRPKPEGTVKEMTTLMGNQKDDDLEEEHILKDLHRQIEDMENSCSGEMKMPQQLKDVTKLLILLLEKYNDSIRYYRTKFVSAPLLESVMIYTPTTEIINEVSNNMSTTLKSSISPTKVILCHRAVKFAMTNMHEKNCIEQKRILGRFIKEQDFYYESQEKNLGPDR